LYAQIIFNLFLSLASQQFYFVRGQVSVALDPQGHVFVSDTGNHRIQKFSNTGGFIRTWNSTSSGGAMQNLPLYLIRMEDLLVAQ
jgi:hypothetical protein